VKRRGKNLAKHGVAVNDCGYSLFHQEYRAAALYLTGDPAVQVRGHAGHAAGENFTALADEFFQEIGVFVIDRLQSDIDPAARHRAIGAAKGGTAFGGLGSH
jgi:hypothetical protein